ncbi:MAG TPA: SDR family NAD(P)-dependent oxidoreductase [Hellea balneolensis]|uniref:SDR family NAD(P)-dependent oxidoreductase n=1 Tax=Hellea balneolensis TaxID=287478 RepID=A0A7C5M067_9PROT|nr:SDR family NAD(P)-dependent oxidoreductase [Hellea balneolensis]
MTEQLLKGRITLVTGASRGIGYATAIELARHGSHIIAVARTQGGLEDLDDAIKAVGGEATLVPMDLRQADGIDQLGGIIYERWGRLDGLLSNAGLLGEIAPVPHIDPKKWEETFAVNVTANFRLIRSMDALLRASDSGRAIFMSSKGAQSRKAYWGVYAASKSALDALVMCYADETEQTNMKINLVYPGPVRTQMRAKAMPGEDPDTLPKPADIAKRLVPLLGPDHNTHGKIISFRKD